MKLILTFIFILQISSSLILNAQVNSDVPRNEEYYVKYRTPINPSYFFIEGAYLSPTGTTGNTPSSELPLLAPFLSEDGFGFANGYRLGIGAILNLSSNNKYKNKTYPIVSIALDYSDYGKPDWESVINGLYTEHVSSFGGDIGFGLAINRSDRLVFEFLGTVGLNFFELPGLYSREPVYNLTEPTIYDFEIIPDYDSERSTSVGGKVSLSLSMRTRRMRISGAYVISRINSPYVYTYYEPRLTGTRLDERKYTFDSSIAMNYLKIGLALVL